MPKREKGKGRKCLKKRKPKPPHKFLPPAVRMFMRVDEEVSDHKAAQQFHQLTESTNLDLIRVNSRIIRVLNPHPAHLLGGRRDNVVALWHGSNIENGLSILRDGFRKGYRGMFGAGIYVGSRVKAQGFTGGRLSLWGLRSTREPEPGMLLKLSVALGRVYQAPEAMNKLKRAPEGFDSVQGIKGVTKTWDDRKLQHDEWCVYHTCQVSLLEIHLID